MVFLLLGAEKASHFLKSSLSLRACPSGGDSGVGETRLWGRSLGPLGAFRCHPWSCAVCISLGALEGSQGALLSDAGSEGEKR